ncbi:MULTISPECIES: 2-isopropylmalate synthase [unclassified Oceanispirochaeta]|uniref:2-isopropylmalate synthase n=1 Tax=unclassified Oceanispirochaeta TaxID=2635722 RepID=UPI000E09228A|nr:MULTISPECIES: 2-isopropylmalate synthase [unclassified Oceanispirochaeta]MBF9015790.1 2-isopropylmalate synthase [Oceanispirochaeta sp. M2]NPD72253.1 2-isopropylmalate synthase [Oceanispirochaeta sp. M1]RDG32349.1 2-isopropylmalate synthase [Oceanispirochaeta sp. M1]
MSYDHRKYKPFPPVSLPDRTWPSKTITKAPYWCSVDLRDGNQALPIPMSVEEKLELFDLLLKIGFKEIEIGFPSASQTEFDYLRTLIDRNLIPDDVTIQLLTQSREHLIRRSFEAIQGCKNVVMHFYNSTSTLQRDVVFKKDQKEIIKIAVEGARLIKEIAADYPDTNIRYEYSPESFTGTELDFALEICEAVMDVLEPTPENKLILNLPATVEMHTPNVHADQIEWFCRNIKNRDSVLISLHTHNDRGTGVAAAELAILAGADRVEGTLFGNGERTGNTDLITMALNMYSQGIDTGLDFSDIDNITEIYKRCTRMNVHERHPYVGELVFTAFSGSHQDAIKKGLDNYRSIKSDFWEIPYLPLDPSDLGREYEAIIRINSQSGKGGVAYILDAQFGYKLPKAMHPEFSRTIQKITDETGRELKGKDIFEEFSKEYLEVHAPWSLLNYEINARLDVDDNGKEQHNVGINCTLNYKGEEMKLEGHGNGPIDAFFHALQSTSAPHIHFLSYDEHALSEGADSQAVCYIQVADSKGRSNFGVGVDNSINAASLKALLCALNRIEEQN